MDDAVGGAASIKISSSTIKLPKVLMAGSSKWHCSHITLFHTDIEVGFMRFLIWRWQKIAQSGDVTVPTLLLITAHKRDVAVLTSRSLNAKMESYDTFKRIIMYI